MEIKHLFSVTFFYSIYNTKSVSSHALFEVKLCPSGTVKLLNPLDPQQCSPVLNGSMFRKRKVFTGGKYAVQQIILPFCLRACHTNHWIHHHWTSSALSQLAAFTKVPLCYAKEELHDEHLATESIQYNFMSSCVWCLSMSTLSRQLHYIRSH